jgi:hypothetical protein
MMYVENHNINKAKEMFYELEKISKIRNIIQLYLTFSKALILRSNPRFSVKLKAVELFKEIIGESHPDDSITMSALIHIVELLILELNYSDLIIENQIEIINEIMIYFDKIHEIAEKVIHILF